MQGELVRFGVPLAHNGRDATGKHLRESLEAQKLAAWVHVADIQLGRCADVPWHELTAEQRQEKADRAAVAIRLGDPLALAVAHQRAAAHVQAEYSRVVDSVWLARDIVHAGQWIWLRHLQGYLGGRS